MTVNLNHSADVNPFETEQLIRNITSMLAVDNETAMADAGECAGCSRDNAEVQTPTAETTVPNAQTATAVEAGQDPVMDQMADSLGIHMSLVSPPLSPHPESDSESSGTHSVDLHQVKLESAAVRAKLDQELPEVFCESRARIPTTNGEEIFLHVFSNNIDNKEHLAIVFGADIHSKTLFAPRPNETEYDRMTRGAYDGKLYPGRTNSHIPGSSSSCSPEPNMDLPQQDVLCRIHSECYTGETAWSARCDCGEQLDEAGRQMAAEGRGVIVYLRQEGRGIGLGEKLKAYNLQDLGADTVTANLMLRHPADARTFGLATAILLDLGLHKIRLMTNNPDKIVAVEGKNKEIEVTERVPMVPLSWQNKGGFQSDEVEKYLQTKVERMGHLLQR